MKKYLSLLFLLTLISQSMAQSSGALSLDAAKKIAEKARSYGAKKSWKLSVAVVNAEGNLVYFLRDDGAYPGSIQASQDKAKSANDFQRPTSAFVQSIKDGRMGLLSVDGIVAVEGGVPIVVGGKHVGAIGVSGARSVEDEEAANAALK